MLFSLRSLKEIFVAKTKIMDMEMESHWSVSIMKKRSRHKTVGQSLWRVPQSARSELHPHPVAEQAQIIKKVMKSLTFSWFTDDEILLIRATLIGFVTFFHNGLNGIRCAAGNMCASFTTFLQMRIIVQSTGEHLETTRDTSTPF